MRKTWIILAGAAGLAALTLWAAPEAEAAPYGASASPLLADVYVGFGYGRCGPRYRRSYYRPCRPVCRPYYYRPYHYRPYYYRPYYPRYRLHSGYYGGYHHHGHRYHHGHARRGIGRRR